MSRLAFVMAVTAATLFSGSVLAHDFTAGSLKIDSPWARATPKGASVGGGYLKITNSGTTPDRLIGGTSDASKRFEIHEMSMTNGVMKMRPLAKGLELKPGATVEFKPGGYHVMFVGLNKQLVEGQKINATLQFEKAGKVPVQFTVEGIGAQSGGAENSMPGMSKDHGANSMPGMSNDHGGMQMK
jgi:periplasmic copper chaperone A